MLSPDEATPRALAFLTLAHELYSGQDDDSMPALLDEETVSAVLADDDGEVDWQAIAVALGMIGHVLLELIPETLYAASEVALSEMIARHFCADPETIQVTINNRVTGTNLLRVLSLRVLELDDR